MTPETPKHYAAGVALDALDLMEIIDPALRRAFAFGNAIKYVSRAGLKAGEDAAADLGKALYYLRQAGYSPGYRVTMPPDIDLALYRAEILKRLLTGWRVQKYDDVSWAAGRIADWQARASKQRLEDAREFLTNAVVEATQPTTETTATVETGWKNVVEHLRMNAITVDGCLFVPMAPGSAVLVLPTGHAEWAYWHSGTLSMEERAREVIDGIRRSREEAAQR